MATLRDCLVGEIETPANIDVDLAVKYFDKHCFISRWQEMDGSYQYKLCRFGKGLKKNVKWVIHPEDAELIIEKLEIVGQDDPFFRCSTTFWSPKRTRL